MNIITYIKIGIAALSATVIFGFLFYIDHIKTTLLKTEEMLSISKENEVKLTEAIQIQKEVLKKKEEEHNTIIALSSNIKKLANNQAKEIKDLNDKLNVKANGTSRDLGNIARAKPNIIQKIVNDGTMNVNRCFEILTGAELKEGEKNNECKDLIKH